MTQTARKTSIDILPAKNIPHISCTFDMTVYLPCQIRNVGNALKQFCKFLCKLILCHRNFNFKYILPALSRFLAPWKLSFCRFLDFALRLSRTKVLGSFRNFWNLSSATEGIGNEIIKYGGRERVVIALDRLLNGQWAKIQRTEFSACSIVLIKWIFSSQSFRRHVHCVVNHWKVVLW